MLALAEIDLGTLTPEQAAAARQALAALETLRTENEAQSERILRLEHLNLELVRLVYGKRSESCQRTNASWRSRSWRARPRS